MNNAIIKTERLAGALYNGMACRIVRDIEKDDLSFNEKTPQVLVLINDREHYFYADEVIASDEAAVKAAEAETKDRPAVKYDTDKHPATGDQSAWDSANALNTVGGMDDYLARYPFGTHAEDARTRRSIIAPSLPRLATPVPPGNSNQARNLNQEYPGRGPVAQPDDAAWNAAVASNTAAAYNDYLTRYPTGVHVAEARARLAKTFPPSP